MKKELQPDYKREVYCKVFKRNNSNIWFKGVILKINFKRNTLKIFFPKKYTKTPFKKGDAVFVSSHYCGSKLFFKGTVQKNSFRLTKQIIKIGFEYSQREYPRFNVFYKAAILRDNRVIGYGYLENMSLTGVLLKTDFELDKHHEYTFQVNANDDLTISFVGEIRHGSNIGGYGYLYGIKFNELDLENIASIINMITFLENERYKLSNQLTLYRRFKFALMSSIAFLLIAIFVLFVATEVK
jgi:hypothetical protein